MQFYCGRMFNFFRFRESDNSIILDLLPDQKDRIQNGKATLDSIYDEIMTDPKAYVDAVKTHGITNLMTICGSLGGNDERSNGTGKSTILESITYALYGCIIRQAINSIRNESIHDVVTCIDGHYPKGLKETWVEWLFEEKGKLYIIRRGVTISGKSKSPVVNFNDITSGVRNSLNGHRTKDTSEQIVKVIGYDFDIFSSSIMFGQNDAGKFLIGKDKDRKEMIVKILHLEDVVNGCLEDIRESKNEKEKEIHGLKAKAEFLSQSIAAKPTVEEINKNILAAQSLIENCDIETKKNNDEVEKLSKSDILKELESIKSEGIKAKSDVASKKADLVSQTQEWTNVLNNVNAVISKKNKELADNNELERKLKAREIDINNTIKSFNLDESKKNLGTVEKAKMANPIINKQYEDMASDERKLSSDIAVEKSNINRLLPEIESLKKQLESAGDNDKFICDKCKSVVSKEHIEKEVKNISSLISEYGNKKAKYEADLDLLKGKILEIKNKKEKIENWLIREGKINASIQKHEMDKSSLSDILSRISESKNTSDRLVAELSSFESQKKDCQNKISSISSKFQAEIKDLEAKLNEIRDRYIKAESDSKSVRFNIDVLRKKNEEISNNKSIHSSKIGSMKKEIDNIASEIKQYNMVREDIGNKTREFQRYIILNDIFGLDGIQTRIVNKYLPALNRYIEEFLTVLSNGEMTVNITTNSAGAIDIDIHGNTGNSYNMISGGEKGILRLSISIGLALLSFVRTAQKPEMICLDEIFGPLDPSRRGAVFQLLSKLQSRFSRVMVISHSSDINDNIPHKILVEKTEGRNGVSKIKEIV